MLVSMDVVEELQHLLIRKESHCQCAIATFLVTILFFSDAFKMSLLRKVFESVRHCAQ